MKEAKDSFASILHLEYIEVSVHTHTLVENHPLIILRDMWPVGNLII